MTNHKRDLDKDAATWDEAPGRVNLANDITRAIMKEIKLTSRNTREAIVVSLVFLEE